MLFIEWVLRVCPGDIVEVREKAKAQNRIQAALALAQNRAQPAWLEVDNGQLKGTFKMLPDRNELPAEYREHLVVELYSK